MSELVIRKLLEVQLNTVTPAPTFAWENVTFTPAKNTPFVKVNLLFGMTENPTMGATFSRPVGLLKVLLCYPEGKGAAEAATTARLIAAKFPRGISFNDTNVRVLIDRTPYFSPAFNEDGFYRLPLTIPFTADVFG